MSYIDLAVSQLKQTSPMLIPEFQRQQSMCVARVWAASRLCRFMSAQEAAAWGQLSPSGGRMNSDMSGLLNPHLLETMLAGESERKPIILKWFSFDRPYLFHKYNINEVGVREGQEYLMTLPIGFEVKAALVKRLLPDLPMNGLSKELRAGACRGKNEGGTITIGIPLQLLEKLSSRLSIERLGGRIFL